MATTRIAGVGRYAPGEAIDNDELVKLTGIELNKERLEGKIGIRKRHIAHLRNMDETSADFAEKAAREAIQAAGIDPGEVGLFIVGSDTPEYISPSTAVLIQGRIQGEQKTAASFDINTSCAGFVTAHDVAARMMAGNPTMRYGVVVGMYNMPAFVKEGDAFGYSIFADGAAAAVLERTEEGPGYLESEFVTDGTQWNYVGVYSGGTRQPITHAVLEEGNYGLQLLQRLPGDRNVKLWPPLTEQLAKKAGLSLEDIDHFIFTQINRSVIQQVMEVLGQPMEKTTTIMDKFGYTGSACVPMAFYEAVKSGAVKRGDTVLHIASGAGLSVAGNVFVY